MKEDGSEIVWYTYLLNNYKNKTTVGVVVYILQQVNINRNYKPNSSYLFPIIKLEKAEQTSLYVILIFISHFHRISSLFLATSIIGELELVILCS